MTTDRGRCPPPPPANFSTTLKLARIHANPESWVRIFWKGTKSLGFSKSNTGNRFDPLGSPWDATKVLYGGTSLETAVAETLLRWHRQIVPGQEQLLPESMLKDRRVARFIPKRDLTVIDATGLGLAPIEAAVTSVIQMPTHAAQWSSAPNPNADDIFQCGADEYPLTQQWAAWFRTRCPDADGLMWVSRQFNTGRCLALFDDRCKNDIKLRGKPRPLYAPGSLERETVDRMLRQLGWGVDR